ncbi:MAG: LysR substrate-binding domain-containing protein [Sedimenticolaceae bacterium]
MKLEWIDDLIAIAEANTLTKAAARRHVTQPAFTRRLRAIEDHLGVVLLDRTRRPARPTQALLDRIEEFRKLAIQLRRVSEELASAAKGQNHVALTCQHSLAMSVVPRLAPRIQAAATSVALRLRTGNRDQCYSMLMTDQASIMMAYDVPGLPIAPDEVLAEKQSIYRERLCPVVSADRAVGSWNPTASGVLPILAYPDDSFMGQVVHTRIYPRLPARFRCVRVYETDLTAAILELTLSGCGVAWLPHLLAARGLEEKRLIDLTDMLGDCPMDVVILRLKTPRSQIEEDVWHAMSGAAIV